jgi:S-DNA-T family DNA segregation ATPase FtsK/SpoIIIE
MASKTPEPQTNMAPFIAAGSVVAAGAMLWFGLPGFAAVYVGLIVAGWMATAPVMTGVKEKSGRVLPSGPAEEQTMSRYQMWSSLKWSMIVPGAGWFPIWPNKRDKPIAFLADHKFTPIQFLGKWSLSKIASDFTFWIAVGLAVAAAAIPTAHFGVHGRLIDAVAVYIVITQMASAVRENSAPEDGAPSTGLDDLIIRFNHADGRNAAIGLSIGAVIAGFAVSLGFGIAADRFVWMLDVSPLQLWQVSLGLSLATAGAVLHAGLRTAALAEWRDLVAARAEWKPRWASSEMKLEQGPRMLTHKLYTDVCAVDTFEASASAGAAAAIYKLSPLIDIQLGSGRRAAFLTVPDNDAQGQPVQGSVHPLRLRIVTWLTGELPDLSYNTADPELLGLALESAVSWVVTEGGKSGRPVLLDARSIAAAAHTDDDDDEEWAEDEDTEDSEDTGTAEPAVEKPAPPVPGAWSTRWAFPDTPGGINAMRGFSGGIGSELGLEVIVDPKAGAMYVGALTENTPEFTEEGLSKHFQEMETEARWSQRWGDVLKQAARQPLVQHQVYAEARLPVGPGGNRRELIKCQPFIIPQGVHIMEFIQPPQRLEPALATTLAAAPFVSVTGLSGIAGVKPGGRHQQAINVYWADKALPETPDLIQPSENNKAAEWLLAGLINRGFDVSRLDRPELINAVPLTDRTSKGHMWKMTLKLYGGVTIEELRSKAQKIRQNMGSAWLRVAEGADGSVVIVAGAKPDGPGFVFAKVSGRRMSNSDYVISLDWEQAFLVSKVIGDGGALPKLTKTDVLPKNPLVQVIDFEMPAGTTRGQFKAAIPLLMSTTDNSFVDVRNGVGGAKTVRILVSKLHPLPDSASVDWAYVDSISGIMPFATSVEGNPVAYDPKVDAHILVAGASGGGKSVSLQVLLYPAAAQGMEIYVVDPTKGGADFGFVRPYAKAFAGTVDEAAALMKHVYAEVRRRIVMNTAHQVGSYRDLPEDIRPKHIYLVMDEFTSLMQADPVSKVVSEDPEVEDDRQAQLRANQSKIFIGTMTGKIAREARSAGVTLVLATQKLSAKMLDTIPGAGDLKTNLSRMLMGNATFGEKQSALKNAIDAPTLGDHVPRGRGLWETSAGIAEIIQVWFEPSQVTFANMLAERREPLPESEKVDLTALIPKAAESVAEFQEIKKKDNVTVEDLGEIEVSFDELLAEFDAEEAAAAADLEDDLESQAEPMTAPNVDNLTNDYPEAVIFLDVDGVIAPIASLQGDADWAPWETHIVAGIGEVGVSPAMLNAIGQAPASIVWTTDWNDDANTAFHDEIGRGHLPVIRAGEGDDHGWWKIGAAEAYVTAHPGIRRVLWIDDKLTEEGPTGLTWGEMAEEALEMLDVQVLILAPDMTDGLLREDWAYATEWLRAATDSGADTQYVAPPLFDEPLSVPLSAPAYVDVREPVHAAVAPEAQAEAQREPFSDFAAPYVAPEAAPVVAPYVTPAVPPVVAPYAAPAATPVVAPYATPAVTPFFDDFDVQPVKREEAAPSANADDEFRALPVKRAVALSDWDV